MKTIGIFGNEYAIQNDAKTDWVSLLIQNYPNNIDVYAEPNSSIYFNMSNFIKYHHKYNSIIFIFGNNNFTTPPINCTNKITGNTFTISHWAGKDHADYIDQNYYSDMDMAKKVKNYFTFIVNDEYTINEQVAAISFIKQIRQDTIIIPAYDYSLTPANLINKYNWSLDTISKQECKHIPNFKYNMDPRCNKLTRPSNEWVFKHITHLLNNQILSWESSYTPTYTNINDLLEFL